MKKEFLATALSCILLSLTLNAYSKPKQENAFGSRVRNFYMYSYSDEWQLNGSVGPQIYVDQNEKLLNPAFSASIKKQLSEFWGIRFKISGMINMNDSKKNWESFSSIGLSSDLMLNLNRIFSNKTYYRAPQFWGYAGVGIDHVMAYSDKGNFPIFNMGLITEIPLSDQLSLSIEPKGVIVPDQYNFTSPTGLPVEGFLTMLFGVTYHF